MCLVSSIYPCAWSLVYVPCLTSHGRLICSTLGQSCPATPPMLVCISSTFPDVFQICLLSPVIAPLLSGQEMVVTCGYPGCGKSRLECADVINIFGVPCDCLVF
jgi:hypothetical protein